MRKRILVERNPNPLFPWNWWNLPEMQASHWAAFMPYGPCMVWVNWQAEQVKEALQDPEAGVRKNGFEIGGVFFPDKLAGLESEPNGGGGGLWSMIRIPKVRFQLVNTLSTLSERWAFATRYRPSVKK